MKTKCKNGKMDVASIRSSADLHCIGDVIYLSDKSIAPARWGRIMKFLKTQKWFSEAAAPCGFIAGLPARHAGPMALDALMHNWSGGAGICSRWENRKEPEWLRLLPRDAQAHIRRDYAVIEGTEPLGIVPSIPFAGFGYIVQEEGRESLHSFTSDAFQVFKIHRLGRIRQLSFLHDPVLREADLANPAMTFDHTRLCHSFDVLAIAALIGKNCGLSEENQKYSSLRL